jgi:anti-anti-sigma factor
MLRYLAEGGVVLAPEQPAALTVSDRWDGRVATVTVRGEIDLSTAEILSDRLDDLARQDPERLVIDLAEVGFMDSSGSRVSEFLGEMTERWRGAAGAPGVAGRPLWA